MAEHSKSTAEFSQTGSTKLPSEDFETVSASDPDIVEELRLERIKSREILMAFMNILEDIDEERLDAIESVKLLKEANQELESFTYSVSHDLRTPLRAIHGYAEILDEDYGPGMDDEAKRLLRVIMANALKMGKLIDDLLIFSRIGRTEISRTRVEMNELIQEVIGQLSVLAKGREIDFRVSPVPPAACDGTMVRLVLMNLLSNAVKYTLPRKKAVIEVGFIGIENFPSQTIKGHGAYFVKDNGVGFSMQFADKLFGVFQRLHSDVEFEGTGIGLANVHRIITKHGGSVWAQGEVDKGAAFYFTLPE